ITSDKPIEQGQFEFDLFAKDHGIYISFSPMDFELNFEVIDINGRLLNAGELIDNHNVLLGVYDKGVYIVRITDKAGKVSKSKKQYNHPTLEVIELDSIVSLQTTSGSPPDPEEHPGTPGDGGNGDKGGDAGNSELKSNSFSETPFK